MTSASTEISGRIVGAPTFLLLPEQALTIIPESNAISLGTTVLICMALGSMFTFLSRQVALQVKSQT